MSGKPAGRSLTFPRKAVPARKADCNLILFLLLVLIVVACIAAAFAPRVFEFWLAVFGVGVVIAYAVFIPRVRGLALQAVLVALPIGAIAIALFLYLKGVYPASDVSDLYQATMALGAVIGGWIFTFLFRIWRDEVAREGRQYDVLIGLQAEIIDFLEEVLVLAEQKGLKPQEETEEEQRSHAATLVQSILGDVDNEPIPKIIKMDRQYRRLVLEPPATKVFDALSAEVQILPVQVLQSIVAFYSQVQDLRGMANDVNKDVFWALPNDRKAELFLNYENVRLDAISKGCRAFWQINEYFAISRANYDGLYNDQYAFWLFEHHVQRRKLQDEWDKY